MNRWTGAVLTVAIFSAVAAWGSEVIQVEPGVIPGKAKADSNAATAGYGSSQVQAQLRINVQDETKAIHFIRDNNDPFVITRTYELKHAEPYGLRSYLNAVIKAKRVDKNAPSVTAVKFNNGRKLLIVSAEAYRFEDGVHGQSIDRIIEQLDQPGMNASSGRPKFIYYPRISTAANLRKMLMDVGASQVDTEFESGIDVLLVDGPLNALFVAAPFWSWKVISDRLAHYDRPVPEIRFSYRVIEIFEEDDDKIGWDFQSWKNNDGADFFSVGGRYRSNWAATFAGGVNNAGANRTEFFHFNPKWNTKYIDFLTSVGKARVVTSGVMHAKNRRTSSITVGSGLFYDDVSEKTEPDKVSDLTKPFEGKEDLPESIAPEMAKGPQQVTRVKNGFRFSLDLIDPVVTSDSTTLTLHAESVSLMGWDSKGDPRLNRSVVETEVQIGNNSKEFVIGGLKKFETVSSVSGLPVLKDIPFLGWLFSSESESTKKSQLIVVASAQYTEPFAPVPTDIQNDLGKISDDVRRAFESPVNNLGFEQYGLDGVASRQAGRATEDSDKK
ncbi:MAG: hypothetical protein IJC73_08215 [Lentisphaeria bacterium]|nr:hypothetical protein [Lentisphaeria bacterium]